MAFYARAQMHASGVFQLLIVKGVFERKALFDDKS
jgi:hypothetical protein